METLDYNYKDKLKEQKPYIIRSKTTIKIFRNKSETGATRARRRNFNAFIHTFFLIEFDTRVTRNYISWRQNLLNLVSLLIIITRVRCKWETVSRRGVELVPQSHLATRFTWWRDLRPAEIACGCICALIHSTLLL